MKLVQKYNYKKIPKEMNAKRDKLNFDNSFRILHN